MGKLSNIVSILNYALFQYFYIFDENRSYEGGNLQVGLEEETENSANKKDELLSITKLHNCVWLGGFDI